MSGPVNKNSLRCAHTVKAHIGISLEVRKGGDPERLGRDMKAAIYCRVSTEDQEREGTSLQSQLDACKKLAQEKGYEVVEEFVTEETYSGLSIDRPKLNEVRQRVRDREVDAVIAYTLDRLSRDPVHFIILQEELERAGVELILVTEDLDSSDMGKLIVHIKGFAAKLEVEKIRERTQRGIRERVKAGKMPSGRRARLYGYTYSDGVRHVNEAEAKYVRDMFRWLLDGETLNGITYRLRELGISTPSGSGYWLRSTIYRMLTNPAYMGKTYCYYQVHKETAKHYKPTRKSRKSGIEVKPYSDGILIEGATPAIITETLFNQAQAILKRNREMSSRNGKVKYLLRGHIYCALCHKKYWGYSRWANGKPDKSNQRYYYCMGRRRIVTPIKCDNRGYQADYLEGIVWRQVEKLLSNPQFVLSELARMKNEPNQKDLIENELTEVLRRLQELDKEQERLLQWALKGFPEETVVMENEKINRIRADLKARKAELEKKIEDAKENEVDLEGVEKFCELAKENLMDFTFEKKRFALEALQVKVRIDGDRVYIEGAIPVVESDIASTLAG